MKRLFIATLLLVPILVCAQSIRYDVEPSVTATQEKYSDTWKKIGKMKVYVVQIASFTGENSSARAQSAVNNLAVNFEGELPGKAYVVFQEPTFKVRIGDFRTRAEAYGALLLIQEQYPNAFVTTDTRKISEIIR